MTTQQPKTPPAGGVFQYLFANLFKFQQIYCCGAGVGAGVGLVAIELAVKPRFLGL
jgi:hypothetical protein